VVEQANRVIRQIAEQGRSTSSSEDAGLREPRIDITDK